MSKEPKFTPFERKPQHLKVDFIKRKEKWESNQEDTDKDISHRRFNTTLTVNQMVTGFKKCVRANEVNQDELITCYRVVLAKLLADPNLSDKSFMSMYQQIQSRANEVYSRRSRELKRIKV